MEADSPQQASRLSRETQDRHRRSGHLDSRRACPNPALKGAHFVRPE
jgi:hypothetical protein